MKNRQNGHRHKYTDLREHEKNCYTCIEGVYHCPDYMMINKRVIRESKNTNQNKYEEVRKY
jgi:hypothetical protein